ncbi:MAG: hypothetical protein IKH65_06055 [Clostridia bacterium]|nr:hypothetical protein [Clostridia bacterium]
MVNKGTDKFKTGTDESVPYCGISFQTTLGKWNAISNNVGQAFMLAAVGAIINRPRKKQQNK